MEVKDQRYKIHLTEIIILRLRKPPKYPGTQYQVQNSIQTKKNQKHIKNEEDELVVKDYPKIKKPSTPNQNLNHQIVLVANEIVG